TGAEYNCGRLFLSRDETNNPENRPPGISAMALVEAGSEFSKARSHTLSVSEGKRCARSRESPEILRPEDHALSAREHTASFLRAAVFQLNNDSLRLGRARKAG